MKKTILLTFMLSIFYLVDAQESINYKLKDKTIEFSISQNEICIEFYKEKEQSILNRYDQNISKIFENTAIIKDFESDKSYLEKVEILKSTFKDELLKIEPAVGKFDVSSLPKGYYIIRIIYNDKVENHKIIVE